MADERLLAPIRRFWTAEQVNHAYLSIFEAYNSRRENVTVIVGKSNEGESANAQVVIGGEDYLRWMDALEQRLQEIDSTAAGGTPAPEDTAITNFGSRYIGT